MNTFLKNRYLIFNLLIVIGLFLGSVLVRKENLKAPIGRHHEFITGHVLISAYMMEKDGPAAHFFSSAFSFDGPADKRINALCPIMDKDSVAYYVSYPPGCFVLPYLFIKATGADISVTSIRAYSVINHFATGLVLFLLINLVFDKKIKQTIFLPAILGYALFLFANGNLWFYSNVYFCDMQVNIFILLSLYFSLKIIKQNSAGMLDSVGLGVSVFLGIYTEWLAIFAGAIIGVVFLFKLRNRQYFKPLLALLLGFSIAVGLTLIQYSQICGFDCLMDYLTNKFIYRSGTTHQDEFYRGNYYTREFYYRSFVFNYKNLLDFNYGLLVLAGCTWVIAWLKGLKLANNSKSLFILAVLFLACLMHVLIFYNFNVVHDFSTVKWALILVLFPALVFAEFQSLLSQLNLTKIRRIAFTLIFLAWTSWFLVDEINSYYAHHRLSDATRYNEILGEAVKKYSNENELVMARIVSPESKFMAKRNILDGSTKEDALQRMELLKINALVFFAIKQYETPIIDSIVRIHRDGREELLFKP